MLPRYGIKGVCSVKKIKVSGVCNKYGLGDGDWFSKGKYAHLGVRIGEQILRNNPGSSFQIKQVGTAHNPIRLYNIPGKPAPVDVSGSVSGRRLEELSWCNGGYVYAWDEEADEGSGAWGWVIDPDAKTEPVIFEVVDGRVTFRRDFHGLQRPVKM